MSVPGNRQSRGQILAAVLAAVLAIVVAHPVLGQESGGSQAVFGQAASGEEAASEQGDEPAFRDRVVFALSGYHARLDRAALEQLGEADAVEALLRDLATEANARPSLRLRAVEALGHFGDAQTIALLEAIVEAPSEALELPSARHGEFFQHQAIMSFARIRREAAAEALAGFLESDNLQLQLSAIEALGRFGGRSGHRRLEQARPAIVESPALRRLDAFIGDDGPP